METVLIVGSSGNIGVSTIIAALNTGRKVIAVVRNKAAEDKIAQHVGTTNGITFAQADVTDEHGVENIVKQVKEGKLPAFQHVYLTVGVLNWAGPIQDLEVSTFRNVMQINVESNYFAYRATVPYLLEQADPNTTVTLISGGAGELGLFNVTAVSQGALFSLANVACLENRETNIRFNEVYLCYRVDYDSVAEERGTSDRIKASDFARVYEGILENKEIRACRVSIYGPADVQELKYKKKLPDDVLATQDRAQGVSGGK